MVTQTRSQSTPAKAVCPVNKSVIFLFLAFISIFSLHAVARNALDPRDGAYALDSTDLEQVAEQTNEQNVEPSSDSVDQDSATRETRFARADDNDTIWNPLSKSWLTTEQVHLLKLAFDIGYRHGGAQHAKLMQSTLMQETIAGLLGRIGHMSAPVGKRSYGVMQVKVSAARDVIRRHPEIGRFRSDEELIARLITDDQFNIRIASLHMTHLRKYTETDAQALMAYNLGLRASKRYKDHGSFSYVKGVRRFYEYVIMPFNRKFNLQAEVASKA